MQFNVGPTRYSRGIETKLALSASVYGSDGGGLTTDTYCGRSILVVVLTFHSTGPFSGAALSRQDQDGIERTRHLVPGSDVPEIPDAHISCARGRVKIVPWLLIWCHNAFNL